MSNFIYSANGDVNNLANNIETMADVSKPLDYFNLVGNLKLAGSIRATDFIRDDGKSLDTITVTKLGLPNNVYYVNGKMGINEEKPMTDLDIKGQVRVQGNTSLNKTTVDGLLKVGRNDSDALAANFGKGIHTLNFKADGTADINNLMSKQFSTTGNANIQGDVVFTGTNKWIVHTPDNGRKTMVIAPGNDKSEWQWTSQTSIENDGKVRVGNHFEVPAKMTVGSSEDPRKFPEWLTLSVDNPKTDSNIRLKTKGDDNKNIYLANRDGNFNVNIHNVGDMFRVNKDGHHYIRHTGDHVMHIEGDGNNPYISLGKTGTWLKKKLYIQNANAHTENPIFKVGVHGDKVLMEMDKASGVRWLRKDNRQTHFDWTDGKNYIRGDTVHDNNLKVGSLCVGNICMTEQNGRLVIDKPVTIKSGKTHAGLTIQRTENDGSNWNYVQFEDSAARRTAYAGSNYGLGTTGSTTGFTSGK